MSIKLVGAKFQVRVEATRDLNRVGVAHHQSAEEGGEDDLYQLLDWSGGAPNLLTSKHGGSTPSRSWSSCALHLDGDNWSGRHAQWFIREVDAEIDLFWVSGQIFLTNLFKHMTLNLYFINVNLIP